MLRRGKNISNVNQSSRVVRQPWSAVSTGGKRRAFAAGLPRFCLLAAVLARKGCCDRPVEPVFCVSYGE
jgi:hypothetical protein